MSFTKVDSMKCPECNSNEIVLICSVSVPISPDEPDDVVLFLWDEAEILNEGVYQCQECYYEFFNEEAHFDSTSGEL